MNNKPTGEDIARHYESAHVRLCELAPTLTADQLATQVAATPGWDVHDVLAHLAALTSDVLGGRLTGAPTDDFTAEQIRQRKGATALELVDEWTGNMSAMLDLARSGLVPPNLSVDALTHEQDIRGALRLPPALAADELRFCASLYALGFGYGLKQAGIAPLAVAATDTDFTATAGVGDPAAAVRAPEFELFRALSGRRSRRQVLGFAWEGDPAAYVERFNVFGAPPEEDITG